MCVAGDQTVQGKGATCGVQQRENQTLALRRWDTCYYCFCDAMNMAPAHFQGCGVFPPNEGQDP